MYDEVLSAMAWNADAGAALITLIGDENATVRAGALSLLNQICTRVPVRDALLLVFFINLMLAMVRS